MSRRDRVCVVNIVVRRTSASAASKVCLFDQVPDSLQDDERRVTFVQVPDRGRRLERLQRPHAADAEDDLLLDAGSRSP